MDRMPRTGLRLVQHLALYAALLAPLLLDRTASAAEPYRMLAPSRDAPHPVVLLVPGCSGFAATNGTDVYEERAAELQAAGYVVVFVDYVGRRMQTNCAHVSQGEVSGDIVEAAGPWPVWNWYRQNIRYRLVIWWWWSAGCFESHAKNITDLVMYYPVCRGAGPWSADVAGLMLLGQIDDIALPVLCDAVAKGMPSNKLHVIAYPNARHGFDMRGLPERADLPSGSPAYNAEAADASWLTVLRFLRQP
jgi:dienelactone hydrolase